MKIKFYFKWYSIAFIMSLTFGFMNINYIYASDSGDFVDVDSVIKEVDTTDIKTIGENEDTVDKSNDIEQDNIVVDEDSTQQVDSLDKADMFNVETSTNTSEVNTPKKEENNKKHNIHYDVINEWNHKDKDSSVYIKKVRVYNSNVYLATVKINNALQFDHVYSDKELRGKKDTVFNMTKEHDPVLAINANGFTKEGLACGTIGSNGVIDQFEANKECLVMDYNGMLHVLRPKTKEDINRLKPFWATTFGPSLVENYKNVQENSTNLASHPRVAIGQKDKANEFLIIVVDGRNLASKGLTLSELSSLFENEGARVAYNLDGGGSSTLIFKGKVINSPSDVWGTRKVVDALFIK